MTRVSNTSPGSRRSACHHAKVQHNIPRVRPPDTYVIARHPRPLHLRRQIHIPPHIADNDRELRCDWFAICSLMLFSIIAGITTSALAA